jgi:signal transduction histidine kinase
MPRPQTATNPEHEHAAAAEPVAMGPTPPSAPGGGVTASELAELIGAFNEVTARLERTHATLRGEVARLNTELSHANAELARSERLAALGQMAAGIAHEVRNPLGSIGLYARMLASDLQDRPEQLAIVRRIAGAVKGLDAVVNDVLSFARELRIRPRPACASDLLERALETAAPAGSPARERLRVATPPPEAEVRVRCDAALAHQALVNVIRNAVEAMDSCPAPEGGHTLTLSAEGVSDGAILSVSDTGPGVSEEVIQRMFNPFFTTRGTGTGLGLAIVHRIVDAHGGRVQVRNTGPGACVELIFPAGQDGTERAAGDAENEGGEGEELEVVGFTQEIRG